MSARSKRRSRTAATRPRRWLALAFGLLVCGFAFWVLVGPDDVMTEAEIDARSRAKLQRVLERAEQEAGR